MQELTLKPITIKEANRIVGLWHRHNRPVQGALFAVGVEYGDSLVGVAIVGRPIGRNAQDGVTCEITRVATNGTYNACSMLYGACCRAAKALGYRRVLTKTLDSEPGTSLKASGFERDGTIKAGLGWDREKRRRIQSDMFGEETTPSEGKTKWMKYI